STEGLADNWKLVAYPVPCEHICGVSGSEQYLDAHANPPGFAGKLNTIHLGHEHIRQKQIEFLVRFEDADGFHAATGAEHLIAKLVQHRRRDLHNVIVIVDQENPTGMFGNLLQLNSGRIRIKPLRGSGQIKTDRGPASARTLDRDVAA